MLLGLCFAFSSGLGLASPSPSPFLPLVGAFLFGLQLLLHERPRGVVTLQDVCGLLLQSLNNLGRFLCHFEARGCFGPSCP